MSEKKKTSLALLKERSDSFIQTLADTWSEDITALEAFSNHQKVLGSRLCLKVDQQLAKSEEDRPKDNGRPVIAWGTIDMQKLFADAADRIKMGLDAMLPNHIWPVVYWNSSKNQYDVDLRVGYKGEDYYKRKSSVFPVKNIRYELVYKTDEFTVIKSDMNNCKEGYTFSITDPFNRGDVVGGFGYIEYVDESLNELIVVTKKDFNDAKNVAKSQKFWNKWPERMQYKTLVHRVTGKLQLDPEKINSTVLYRVKGQEYEDKVQKEINTNANRKQLTFNDAVEDAVIKEEKKTVEIPKQPVTSETIPSDSGNNGYDEEPGF